MQMNSNHFRHLVVGVSLIVIGIALDLIMQIVAMISSQGLALAFGQSPFGWWAIGFMLVIMAIFTTIIVWILFAGIRKVTPQIGFHPLSGDKILWSFYGYALILVAGIVLNLIRVLVTGGSQTSVNQANLQGIADSNLFGLFFILILATCFAPLVEELIFRGVIMNYFFKTSPHWWANVVLSGAAFGYFHVYSAFNPWDFLQYTVMGIILAVVYKKTHQIQYAMLTHLLNNLVSSALMVLMVMG